MSLSIPKHVSCSKQVDTSEEKGLGKDSSKFAMKSHVLVGKIKRAYHVQVNKKQQELLQSLICKI
jgi:hypothetical protein